MRLLRLCCEEDAFLLPKPLDEERLSGDASCGSTRAWRASGRARARVACVAAAAARNERRRKGEGGVGKEPSAELGKGTELRSDTCSGDHGLQAEAHGGHGGHGGQGSASAGEEARNSGGAALGCSGARRRGWNPPSEEEEGASEGAADAATEGARAPQPAAEPPHRDAGHTQLAVNRKHCTILDIPRSLNLEMLIAVGKYRNLKEKM